RIRRLAEATDADLCVIEVGGTVGDIESLPFLEAIRQLRNEVGRENVAFVHLALMPFVGPTKELKTKPTQHSVKELRSIGIQPDVIVARSDYPVPEDLKDKIALFCDVDKRGVVPLETAETIYAVPLILEESGLADFVAALGGLDGIVVPGGFGYRGVEGKIRAARFARERQIPYLGLCLGMQVMCIEFARHALGEPDANSTEFDLFTKHPVIDLLP